MATAQMKCLFADADQQTKTEFVHKLIRNDGYVVHKLGLLL